MILVEMRGRLEPVRLNANKESMLYELNVAAAAGKQFILMQDTDEHMVGISVHEVLTFTERDDDDDADRVG